MQAYSYHFCRTTLQKTVKWSLMLRWRVRQTNQRLWLRPSFLRVVKRAGGLLLGNPTHQGIIYCYESCSKHANSKCRFISLFNVSFSSLLAIKRVQQQQQTLSYKLEFAAPAAGRHSYKLYLMCDAYMGCDQEYDITIDVQRAWERYFLTFCKCYVITKVRYMTSVLWVR